ncbi:hypothetical protein HA402_014528 [Bradysia odoriphaga]|nr:hypothetical protein HA402_014528 [Bradysia odoriphaga]
MEARKEEFRKYLEESGVISALTKAIIKLYEMKYDRPESAVEFIQQHLVDSSPSLTEYQNVLNELEESRAKIAALERELEGKAGMVTDMCPMEKLYNNPDCKSLLKAHLTTDLYEKLKDKKTATGKTLHDCINSGLMHHKSSVGIYAADHDAYDIFCEIFDPIIADYHKFPVDQSHPPGDGWAGDDSLFVDLDPSPDHQYIKSTRIRCARSMENFPLNPGMSEKDYSDLMTQVTDVLATLSDDLSGKFYPLEGMDPAEEEKMIRDHQLFKSGDEHLRDAGALNHWPKGRGIFKNATDTFLVWVNEEDHLRFISMDQSGDIQKTYNRLKEAVTQCSNSLKFKRHDRLGWITFCPTNLGSSIRASVMIRLPNLAAKGNLQELADEYHLQIRGTHGEHSETVDGLYEISNKRRLGITEFDAVKEMYDGIKALLEAEKLG